MTEIIPLSAPLTAMMDDLVHLLADTVAAGASVGFHAPVERPVAEAYWHAVEAGLKGGEKILIAAVADGRVVGTVQLGLENRANGAHRAEVQKLMVHPEARGQGLGRALMAAVEAEATAMGRTLLVLDTRTGDVAEGLYKRIGYTHVGTIPAYAIDTGGSRSDTTIFYKQLNHE